MSLNTAKYTATQSRLEFVFRDAAAAVTPFYPTVCTEISSTHSDENYGFLGSMPGVREWIGNRVFKELRAGEFSLKNRDWEGSLEIAKNDIDDDRIGLFEPTAQELAQEAMLHPDELLFDVMVAGESAPCFDGQYFYDTDHVWGDSGSQSNDLSATAANGTTPTADEFRTAFHDARVAMLKYKNDQGKFLNRQTGMRMSNLLCVVPPEMHLTAITALDAPTNSYGATNVVLDKPVIVSDPRLTNSAKWFLHNLSGTVKPFVFQKRKPVQFAWKGADDIEHKTLKAMTWARYAMGYGAWWKSVLVTFT